MGRFQCGTKTVQITNGTSVWLKPMYCGHVIDPDACYVCRERRRAKVLHTIRRHAKEGLYWKAVSSDEADKITNRIRRTVDGWYMRLPQLDNTVIVIANVNKRLKGYPLPCDREQLEQLIAVWVLTPRGERLSTRREQKKQRKSLGSAKTEILSERIGRIRHYWDDAKATVSEVNGDELQIYAEQSKQAKVRAALEADGIETTQRRKKDDNSLDDLLEL